ncbi:hypothetical protein ABAC460_21060 [Asticcacaulis sp. AC460]|uniref:ankyrin repeat domain-containing protein n=1 Tax=Asticcacaulis sp. AC460 TaxID=1282360 RepID=UPI0003C3C341|nr:ankyrin repeat domain-containing protein [Asticcacaulis sp. AC460]ESQ87061.1 hypothetical protein ABAC460_21060 [Asticcacaulis sp. AC460]
MRAALVLAVILAAGLAGICQAGDLPPACTDEDTVDIDEASIEDANLRGGDLASTLSVPYGSLEAFDFFLRYVIGADGRIRCLSTEGVLGRPFEWTPERRSYLDRLAQTMYQPFLSEAGTPKKMLVTAYITEEEQPPYHVMPPRGDTTTAEIRMTLQDHHNDPFVMSVTGTGEAHYRPLPGEGPSRYFGPQTYLIPPERVAEILDVADAADFWSWRDIYYPTLPNGIVIDTEGGHAIYREIVISRAGRTKTVRDYGMAGAPIAFRKLFDGGSERMGASLWWKLDEDTIGALSKGGFDFSSQAACDLLQDTAANRNYTDDLVLSLLEAGTPRTCTGIGRDLVRLERSLLDSAILGRRTDLAKRLIADGALTRGGTLDHQLVTRALVHAAAGGTPETVDLLLAYKPDLSFRYRASPGGRLLTDPVITFVGRAGRSEMKDQDLIVIARSLVAAGADLHAYDSAGQNLFIHALYNSQLDFARWLLAQGARPQVRDGGAPWFMTNDQDQILVMLEAGAAESPEALADIIVNARTNDQKKVEAWLRAHGKWPD